MCPIDVACPAVVLDTNVVLDWLVFRNPDCDAFAGAIVAGTLRWLATAAMREELAHVLGRGHLDRWAPDVPSLWAQWSRHCIEVSVPASIVPAGRLRCSDPDDQKFIDLAIAAKTRWLLSHDRAVLKLARRLQAHGVNAVLPGGWMMPERA